MRKGCFNLAMTQYYIVGEGVKDFDIAVQECIPWCLKNGFEFQRYEVKPYDESVKFRVVFNIPRNYMSIPFSNFN